MRHYLMIGFGSLLVVAAGALLLTVLVAGVMVVRPV